MNMKRLHLRAGLREIKLIVVEWLLKDHVLGLCWAFGGIVQPNPMYQDRIGVRVCLKPRWHTDSHAYTIVDPDYQGDPRAWRVKVDE